MCHLKAPSEMLIGRQRWRSDLKPESPWAGFAHTKHILTHYWPATMKVDLKYEFVSGRVPANEKKSHTLARSGREFTRSDKFLEASLGLLYGHWAWNMAVHLVRLSSSTEQMSKTIGYWSVMCYALRHLVDQKALISCITHRWQLGVFCCITTVSLISYPHLSYKHSTAQHMIEGCNSSAI